MRLSLRSLAALLVLAVCTQVHAREGFGRLTVEEVASKIGQKDVFLFDNNGRDSWVKGHVPSAQWLDYAKVRESDLPADKAATLVFYCGNEQCHACHKAAATAIQLGYKNVYIMPAGIAGWRKSGKNTEPGT